MLPNWITDYPTAWLGLVSAAIAEFVAFGVRITPDQTTATLALFGALFAVVGIIGHATTVPKTPSSPSAPIQTPPPGP